MERQFNFSAGPGTLPLEVLQEAQDEMLVYRDAGASVIEISHRSPQYTAVVDSARSLLRELLGIGDDWSILFLQSGASLQFYQAPLNFLTGQTCADYVITGAWAKKAHKEASMIGDARIAASSADSNFSYIPDTSTWKVSEDAAYLHMTSNNTIYGTQIKGDPDVGVPLICDASSDFLSRPIDMSKYGLMYAGAQKNIGPAGATVVLVRPDFLKRIPDGLPTLMDYRTHAAKLFHTPPVFAVYMIEKVLRWVKGLGGLDAMKTRNDTKAAVLYNRIDKNDFYRGVARPDSRSDMNVTFRLPSEDLEAEFIAEAKNEGLLALKGHRSAGGVRASIYNACPPEGVDALVSFMNSFEANRG
ncbi:MAG: 3-phosphoserine/phosphohydroxythreonine transaminase [Bacteroidetes Order II. Incertae sedis bacterium]|jgi:phosphoserine aminotransferase|nr:3-phosphoserine/phosphohydroxythreonine transaminase [Bacteroidetes Order II. bacterium]MBT4601755.1 3-phosphoserine/phosphohydroxythreonine transaminase [Bacteroidetes Order II. bacterium]MBT5251001.1 3-phosphoserine/phosphohydroxythreonine transaminase [Bacteroidetes Order II. bacterium]MBT6200679.1 3-phosphoserine/phosphohydroxythreonine transaminase [Bacteroidetes Order II. bacterium]MBT6425368.1 3-phosphoserine/phosphohydroxythreonine transaminase [Bacteroidetes Order II. bacterium]